MWTRSPRLRWAIAQAALDFAGADPETRLREPSTRAELRLPTAAAQKRIVSVARIRQDLRKSARVVKGIIIPDVSEFESYMLFERCNVEFGTRKAGSSMRHQQLDASLLRTEWRARRVEVQ